MANCKNKYGQYMTPEIVANFMVSLADLNDNSSILEPSSGEGVFIDILKNKGYKNITAYEIDKSIIKNNNYVINESFISTKIDKKYDLIIGNPPYIRWKNLEQELKDELSNNELWNKHCNSLCDYSSIFIIKAIELLNENGQLIFITPEYWLNTTHSITLRNYMLDNGYFEQIYHFNETPIFEKATVSTIIFKFIKSSKKINKKIKIAKYFKNKKLDENILYNLKNGNSQPDTEYIELDKFEKNENWILAQKEIISELIVFEKNCKKETADSLFSTGFYTIKDFCDIGNGMVSGLDKAFQINTKDLNAEEKKYLIKVIKAKSLEPFTHNGITDYFLIEEGIVKSKDEFIKKFPNFYQQLQIYIEDLDKRYQYNREIKFWEWVFLRNYKLFSQDKPRLFVPCKERISNKDYFRFSFIEAGIYPTQDVTAIFPKKETKESIYYILALLNSKFVFDWLRFNGIVKGNIVEFSEKPIASIPYRKIDFTNLKEKTIHDNIVEYTNNYIKNKKDSEIKKIAIEFNKLFNI
jgi:adenine-specific DNA-methyltransferase